MKIFELFLIIMILLNLYLLLDKYFFNEQENFATDFEAIANVASLYNNSNMTVSNMTVTHNASVNGTLNSGNINAGGNISAGGVINTSGAGAVNGWISGHHGLGDKDKVVIGNLENQACIGAHNKDFNAWTDLRLQGNSINLVPNNGKINLGNNWSINTSDGHFRLYYGDSLQFTAHNPNAGDEWANIILGKRMRTDYIRTPTIDMISPNGSDHYNLSVLDGQNMLRINGSGPGLAGWADIRTWTYSGNAINW